MSGISSAANSASVHWTYSSADKTTLCQGDIIERTDSVLSLLREVHPYFAKQEKYLSFMLITQSCDLVKRRGQCNARHLTIAGVRSLSDIIANKELERIAAGQAFGREVSMACKAPLLQFLDRLLNNNEPNYFFLRADTTQGVGMDSCATLRVSVPLRVDHYDILLDAKRGQLADVFQAKLGWLVGTNYSRVGTPDWYETEQRKSDFERLRTSIASTFEWTEEKRFKKVLKLHKDRGIEPTEKTIGQYKNDPATEVLRRATLFRRAFDSAWPESEAPNNVDEHRARAIERADVIALAARLIEAAWPATSQSRTREEVMSGLQEAARREITDALRAAFDLGWSRAPRGHKRNKLLADLTRHNDFLEATKDP